MTESNTTQSKQYLLYALIILLFCVLGFQTWSIMNLKQRMDDYQDIASSDGSDTINTTAITQEPSSTAEKAASISQQIKKNIEAQIQSDQQGQSLSDNPPSLFDDDFFNQAFSGQNWNPYEEIERMQRHMDKVFNNAFGRFNNDPDFQHLFNQDVSAQQLKVKEDDSKYTVILNLPGADAKNISVNLDGQQLTVKGDQDFSQQKKDAMGNVVFQQRRSGTFQRSITLPEPVKQNGMVTHVDHDVLTITVPKAG